LDIQHASKRIPHVVDIPNLIEIQLDSYRWFLEEGMPELFESFSPITDFTGSTSISLRDFVLGEPKYAIEDCRDRDMTFEASIKAKVELTQANKDVIESEVYLGDLPLMTDKGTFIVNGAERVVVSQLARSPGVYFEENLSFSGRVLYQARIIPNEGAWVEVDTDTQREDVLNVQIGQAKKFALTTLLRALSAFQSACVPIDVTVRAARQNLWIRRALPGGESEPVRDFLLRMTLDQPVADPDTGEIIADAGSRIIDTIAERDAETARPNGDDLIWVALEELEQKLGPDAMIRLASPCNTTPEIVLLYAKRQTLGQDVDGADVEVDPATGEVLNASTDAAPFDEAEAAAQVSAGALTIENLIGKRSSIDVLDAKSGKTIVHAYQKMDRASALAILKQGLTELTVYSLHRYIEATLDQETGVADSRDALIDIYKKLRPGDPVTDESARNLFQNNLYDPRRYDLGKVGRFKMNKKLELPAHEGHLASNARTLTREDVVHILRYIVNLDQGHGTTDDIDHLENKRIRSVGELLYSQLRMGFLRMEKVAKERMTSLQPDQDALPQLVLSVKPISAAIKSFFGSSQLSQFMDQTNPLAELTSKRRLSALGPGGLSRQSAKLEVRDVHHSHYGRICPIETPEGPNIGLIGSMAVHARVDSYGFLETPYRKVKDGCVSNDIIWMTADEDHRYRIAPGNERLDADGRFVDRLGTSRVEVQVRHEDQYPVVPTDQVQFMDVSPMQLVSVATAMIPFLENDDANRALMGSNMQRQAVPTLRPSAPLVKTGVERRAAKDSGAVIVARRGGTVKLVTSRMIQVQSRTGEVDTYRLVNMLRSNQSTCITQRPLVNAGQRVRTGQVLADGPCTDRGELALGQNVLVAFMPWGGYNYEDAILISERLVKDDVFTSVHIEKYEKEARDTKLGPEEITRDIPNVGEDMLKDLDENGIIRIGAEVRPDDILVGEVAPKGQGELTAEERLIIAIFGKKAEETRDVSLRVPHGEKGKVVDVKVFSRYKYSCVRCKTEFNFSKRPDRALCEKCDGELVRETPDELNAGVNQMVRVHIAQKRKIMEGDKMAGRHGNKGVISKILPEEDMPFLPNGTPVDIVLNPLGVPSRMNIGQILETHLGLAGRYLGCSFVNPAFEGATDSDILGELEFVASDMRAKSLDSYVNIELGLGIELEEEPSPNETRDGYATMAPKERLKAIQADLRAVAARRLDQVRDALKQREAAQLEVVSQAVCGPVVVDGEVDEVTTVPEGYDYDTLVNLIKENAYRRAGLQPDTGKCKLRDGRTGDEFDQPVTIGQIYMLKLAHLVDDKIHARSTGPYSLVTQQPLGGKAQFGGQRFGEMEVWALEAYGAAYTLQEILTIKSDDVQGRVKTYEAIVKGDTMLEPGVPESFKILVNELQSLCLKVSVEDDRDREIDLKDRDDDINPNEDPMAAAARRRDRTLNRIGAAFGSEPDEL
jgi:DNA-directed RNA polymerase subunit beta